MIIDIVVVGDYKTNCYILTLGNDVLVIDPGAEYEKIKPSLKNKNILGALITHDHPDHTGEIRHFNRVFDYNNLKEGDNTIGPFEFEVIRTPGHRFDSVTYYFKREEIMFTGDFIFKGTIGRTDLETGCIQEMAKSIDKIKDYPNAKIFPGHGKGTTLGAEKINNIYF